MPSPANPVPFNALDRQNTGEVGARLCEVAARIIGGGWYVLGKEVAAFENEFADYCGTRHAVGVANGSDALELAIGCLDLPADCEIAVAPNAAMYATLAIVSQGKKPLFVDVDANTATMDAQSLEATITAATRAVVVTHLYGRMAQMDALLAVAQRHGLAVIEDCAQAHGAALEGRRAGSFGRIGCFSFYPTKNLGALGDGGAVVTDDEALADRVRQLRQYGWKRKYDVTVPHGRNSRLDELQAALLRVKLPLLDSWNERRREIALRYSRAIRHPRIAVPAVDGPHYVGHLYVVRSEQRDSLRTHLAERGIGVDVHYPIPDHHQQVFGERYANRSLPIAERLANTVLSLPCFPELRDDEIASVIDACNDWIA